MYPFLLLNLLITFQSCDKEEETPAIAISDFHGSGVIFYLDETGEYGFACAVIDQSYGCPWGCSPSVFTEANKLTLGKGAQNTADILSVCYYSDIAAANCDDLQLNEKDDWFLPSIDELNLMYQESDALNETSRANGGDSIEEANYWTSSHSNSVWVQNFNGGRQYANAGNDSNHVHAI